MAKRELEQPSCSAASHGATGATGAKRARFSIDTLLDARPNSPESSDFSPCPSPEFAATHAKPSTTASNSSSSSSSKPSQSSLKGDLLDGMECRLEGAELWEKFYELGTEMIITKSGR
ncbi:hypothetical protein ANCDUO_08930 [Ancylostoma duodenale]|uniref:T-box domain-containing protein n=1 Tax=Ancylostoma duodenale TaxID=51022 RepID=A0A0C2GHY7_9BILA|nr:hypothetical protein ANCDUO_08930 [Ancylostoma duodenale]